MAQGHRSRGYRPHRIGVSHVAFIRQNPRMGARTHAIRRRKTDNDASPAFHLSSKSFMWRGKRSQELEESGDKEDELRKSSQKAPLDRRPGGAKGGPEWGMTFIKTSNVEFDHPKL